MKGLQEMNFNLVYVTHALYKCFSSIKQSIKISLTIDNLQRNQDNDIQKYFEELSFQLPTQYLILRNILALVPPKIKYLPYNELEQLFKNYLNEGIGDLDNLKEKLKEIQRQFTIIFIQQRSELLKFQPVCVEITSHEGKYQQQQIIQENSFREIFELIKNTIQNDFSILQSVHVDHILGVIEPIQEFLRQNLNFNENQDYWMRFIKIRFQVQLSQLFNGEERSSNYINELFLFNFKNWNCKYLNGYLESQFTYMQDKKIKYYEQIFQGLYCQIYLKELMQNQLLQFFKNEEIRNLMEQAQEQLQLPKDSEVDFLYLIKFVYNPDYSYFCETINDFGIIINLYQIIELYKGQIKDNIEFREVLLAYITVITIQGWTQLQLLELNQKKILTYDKNLDSQDKQFLLTHMIFGQTDGKSNLKAINKHTAEQINKFQTVERLQNFLKSYTNEGQQLEEM